MNDVDAPVSGGVRDAVTVELSIMVGGEGLRHAHRALDNVPSVVGMVAAARVLPTATRFASDPATSLQAIIESSGRNDSSGRESSQSVPRRTFNGGVAASLTVTELRTAGALADLSGVPSPVGKAALEVCGEALDGPTAGVDHSRAVRALDHMVGVERAIEKTHG